MRSRAAAGMLDLGEGTCCVPDIAHRHWALHVNSFQPLITQQSRAIASYCTGV